MPNTNINCCRRTEEIIYYFLYPRQYDIRMLNQYSVFNNLIRLTLIRTVNEQIFSSSSSEIIEHVQNGLYLHANFSLVLVSPTHYAVDLKRHKINERSNWTNAVKNPIITFGTLSDIQYFIVIGFISQPHPVKSITFQLILWPMNSNIFMIFIAQFTFLRFRDKLMRWLQNYSIW